MMVILLTISLLAFSFGIHVVYWRISMPLRTTTALLIIFFGVLIISLTVFLFYAGEPIVHSEILQFILLYSSASLVYVILYSAIEQKSPTLEMVSYINNRRKKIGEYKSLIDHLNPIDEINKRLVSMEQTGWIYKSEQGWYLTAKGRRIAKIFEYTAIVFGLTKGG